MSHPHRAPASKGRKWPRCGAARPLDSIMTSNPNDRVFRKIKDTAAKARKAREGIEQAQRDFKSQREAAKEEAKKKRAAEK